MHIYSVTRIYEVRHRKITNIAGGLGFEPRYSPSKGDVLPLDDPPVIPAILFSFLKYFVLAASYRNAPVEMPDACREPPPDK